MLTSNVQRFTAYRRALSERGTHDAFQANADDEPQFEGVIWSDGTVTLRWLTACKSTAVWASIEDCLRIHGHPEYGTVIDWHDGAPPAAWVAMLPASEPADEDLSLVPPEEIERRANDAVETILKRRAAEKLAWGVKKHPLD